MENLIKSLPGKIAAIFLITFIFIGTFLALAMSVLGVLDSLKTGSARSPSISVAKSYLYEYGYVVARDYHQGLDLAEHYSQANFLIEIKNKTDQLLWSNYTGNEDILTSVTTQRLIYAPPPVNEHQPSVEAVYNITLFAKSKMTRSDMMGWMLYLINLSVHSQTLFIILSALGLVLFFVLLIYLFCSVGHRQGKDEIVLNRSDRIPFDLFTLLFVIIVFLEYQIFSAMQHTTDARIIINLVIFWSFAIRNKHLKKD